MRIILIGFGVVGQSLAKLLVSRSADLYSAYGMKPRVVACVDAKTAVVAPAGLDLKRLLENKKESGSVAGRSSEAHFNANQVIENVEAEIVIECTATNLKDGEPGMSHLITAMRTGKHVISVNKGPLALAFPSLVELASYNGVMLRFSGTVGGGTPILEFAKRCLKGDRITSFRGILNGTTNYILSRMEEGMSYREALADASSKGYAEADPTLDVEGFDAAAKLVIMANWIMGMKATLRDVVRSGITAVSEADVKRALKSDSALKLLATCDGKRLEVSTGQVPTSDPICVNGTLNAVSFSSEHSGTQTIIGKGAGGMETASAILRDMIEIRENVFSNK